MLVGVRQWNVNGIRFDVVIASNSRPAHCRLLDDDDVPWRWPIFVLMLHVRSRIFILPGFKLCCHSWMLAGGFFFLESL